jgi:hypothetical protein
MDITDEQMVRINEKRIGKEYFDAVAANDVNGTSRKPRLTVLPFICLFEFGGGKSYDPIDKRLH